jgi:hypothetical protein
MLTAQRCAAIIIAKSPAPAGLFRCPDIPTGCARVIVQVVDKAAQAMCCKVLPGAMKI